MARQYDDIIAEFSAGFKEALHYFAEDQNVPYQLLLVESACYAALLEDQEERIRAAQRRSSI